MSDDVSTIFQQLPNVDAVFAIAVYVAVPLFPLGLGVWYVGNSSRYRWKGGPIKRFFCFLSTLFYEFAPAIALGNIFWAIIILCNQASFYYNNLHVSQEVDYYLKVDSRPFDNTDTYQSALSLNSVNTLLDDLVVIPVGGRRMQSGSSDILTIVYHTDEFKNMLKEDLLVYTCLTEQRIIDNVGCIDASSYQSIIPLVFNLTSCEYLTTFELSLPLFGLSDNAPFRADSTVYDSTQSSVVLSYFQVGSCDEETRSSFESDLNSNQVEDVDVTFVSSHFIREEMEDVNDDALSATLFATLWGWLVLVVSTRGFITASTVIFCVLFSVVNAAALLESLDYERVSSFNAVGIMVLLVVGLSYVTLFGSAFRAQVSKGANSSHLTTLEVYLTVSQGILLTTIACCLAFFAMASSNIVFVSQLGYFLGVSMVLFYLNLHYIIIPMFLFTSWYVLPRSWHMRFKMVRRHYMENVLAQFRRNTENAAAHLMRGTEQEERESPSEASSGDSHSIVMSDDESKSDIDSPSRHAGAAAPVISHHQHQYQQQEDEEEEATVVTADNVRFASPGHESAAAPAVVAVPAGGYAGFVPAEDERAEEMHPLELEVLPNSRSADSGDNAHPPSAGASAQIRSDERVSTEENNQDQQPAASASSAARSSVWSRFAVTVGLASRNRSDHRSANRATGSGRQQISDDTNNGEAVANDGASVASGSSSTESNGPLITGKRLLQLFGFVSLCLFVIALLLSYFMSVRVMQYDYTIPQFLPRDTNLGEALQVFRNYKSDVFSTVYNNNKGVFADHEDRFDVPFRIAGQAQKDTDIQLTANSAANSASVVTPLEVSAWKDAPTTRMLGSSDYTDYSILTCWGLEKAKSGRDGDVVADFDSNSFLDYLANGIELDFENLCNYVDAHRGSLDVHPDWDVDRDCIYAQVAAAKNDTDNSGFVFDGGIPEWGVAIGLWALQSYTAGNMVGLLSIDSFDLAQPVWVCANFTLRTDEDALSDDPFRGKNLRQRWIAALDEHGAKYADKSGVRSIVAGFGFSYPLLGVQVDRTLQYISVVFIAGFFVILLVFTLSDLGLTFFSSLGMFAIFGLCLCLALYIIDTTLTLFDVVLLTILLPVLVNYPVNLMEEFIAARAFHERATVKADEDEEEEEHFLTPALERTLKYSRPALFHPTLLAVVVALPFMFADFPFLRRTGEYTILVAITAYLVTVLLQPYLMTFGCKTRCMDDYCTYYDDEYYEDYYPPASESAPRRSQNPSGEWQRYDPRAFEDTPPAPVPPRPQPAPSMHSIRDYNSNYPTQYSRAPSNTYALPLQRMPSGRPASQATIESYHSMPMQRLPSGRPASQSSLDSYQNDNSTVASNAHSEYDQVNYTGAGGGYYPAPPPYQQQQQYPPPRGPTRQGSYVMDDDNLSYYSNDTNSYAPSRSDNYSHSHPGHVPQQPQRQRSAAPRYRNPPLPPAPPAPPAYYSDADSYYGDSVGVGSIGNTMRGGSPHYYGQPQNSSMRLPAPSQPAPPHHMYDNEDDFSYSHLSEIGGAGRGEAAVTAGSYAGSYTGSYIAGDGYDSGGESRTNPNVAPIFLPRNNSNTSFNTGVSSAGPPSPRGTGNYYGAPPPYEPAPHMQRAPPPYEPAPHMQRAAPSRQYSRVASNRSQQPYYGGGGGYY